MKRPLLALLLPLFALSIGCPGSLKDPDRFKTGGVECTLAVDVETELFPMRCSGGTCHSMGGTGVVDLVSPNVRERLFDVVSTCAGKRLVDTASVADSVILKRIGGASECGTPMPLGTNGLVAEERDCIHAWILDELSGNGGTM
jgi:hypothetical protein